MSSAYQILKKNFKPIVQFVRPPREMFRTGEAETNRTLGTQYLFQYESHSLTENGICVKYRDIPYLAKGFPAPETVKAIGIIKVSATTLLKHINPLKLLRKKSRLDLANSLVKLSDNALLGYWVNDEYLCPFAREVKKFLNIFLNDLGYPVILGDVFAHFMQFDDNYRYRLQDLASETNSHTLLWDLDKEIKRLLRLSISRDVCNAISKPKFALAVKFLTIGLHLPKVRRAFKKALVQTDFNKFYFDEADRYFCLLRNEYNFFGQDIKTRQNEFLRLTPVIPEQFIF